MFRLLEFLKCRIDRAFIHYSGGEGLLFPRVRFVSGLVQVVSELFMLFPRGESQ